MKICQKLKVEFVKFNILILFVLAIITNIFGSLSSYLIIILPILILIIGFYVLITNFKNHVDNSYHNKFQ